MGIPSYVRRFRDSLLAETITQIELGLTTPPVNGHRGILTTSTLQYNREPWQLLGRELEFTFYLPSAERIEVSIQLYENAWHHYRLFAYCKAGMLLSVNLTLLQRRGSELSLSQHIKLATRGISSKQRAQRAAALRNALAQLGLEVSDEGRLILGTFNSKTGKFLDTTAKAFVRDFVLAAFLKGHFMGNKGYELPKLPRVRERMIVARATAASRRTIPLSLRFKVLDKANSRCLNCGRGPSHGVRLHVDHIVPFSQGGRTELSNLQSLCHLCNLGKGNRSSRRIAA